MRFKDLRNLDEIYDLFISSGNKAVFSDTEQAINDFEQYVLSLGIDACSVHDICENVLKIGCVFEHQGFLNGLTKGINLHMDSEILERR